jgi:hypothetical protein
MIRRLSRQFTDEEWSWLATVNEFELAARTSDSFEELHKLGKDLIAKNKRIQRLNPVMAG